jgi:FdhD protein
LDCPPEIDEVAIEEPLEIRLVHFSRGRGQAQPNRNRIAVTMRTPGHDLELALGFLYSESILTSPDEILSFHRGPNLIELTLSPSCRIDPERFQRRFYVSSSCGVCGKSSIDEVWEQARHCDRTGPGTHPFISAELIAELPKRLRDAQEGFSRTGGLHASGLFSESGDLLVLREDVGRHNALDKVIGRAFLNRQLPLDHTVLALSGRVSFELMQKAAMAGIRVITAVGAPSSLAVRLAQEFDLTLIGFVRNQRFNIYHGDWRIT